MYYINSYNYNFYYINQGGLTVPFIEPNLTCPYCKKRLLILEEIRDLVGDMFCNSEYPDQYYDKIEDLIEEHFE